MSSAPTHDFGTGQSQLLEDRVWKSIQRHLENEQDGEPFMVVDLQDLEKKVKAWRRMLPRVEPFYALKCHDDDRIVKRLVKLGVGFDCASAGEMRRVMALGAPPSKIIYAHPCKPKSHLEHAELVGVLLTTFDNEDELMKIKEMHPNAELLLRLLPDDSSAVCRLGQKFGADLETLPSLLRKAKELKLKVRGCSYHVGSGCQDIAAFSEAVHLARRAFDVATKLGFKFDMLDIGGGFPGEAVRFWKSGSEEEEDDEAEVHGDAPRRFPDIARQLAPTLDQLFPAKSGVRIVAEPGRYLVHSSCTLMANIIGRRITSVPIDESDAMQETIRYYINEGVYGSFNNIIYDHAHVDGFPVRKISKMEEVRERLSKLLQRRASSDPVGDAGDDIDVKGEFVENFDDVYESSVWGPTCDGLDCVLRNKFLPRLETGDWICFPNMGAYTVAAAAVFNGFPFATKIYVQ